MHGLLALFCIFAHSKAGTFKYVNRCLQALFCIFAHYKKSSIRILCCQQKKGKTLST